MCVMLCIMWSIVCNVCVVILCDMWCVIPILSLYLYGIWRVVCVVFEVSVMCLCGVSRVR